MQTHTTLAVLTLSFALAALPAAAQRRSTAARVPGTGMNAVSGSIGVATPSDPNLTDGFSLAGSFEHYLSPRVSIRGELAGSWWNTSGRGFQADLNPLFVDADVVYNWEGGAWHPYIDGGLGVYHFSFDAPPVSSAEDKLGLNAGAGLEYFTSPHTTFFGDVRFHSVQDINPLVSFQASFWRVSAGLKHYF